MKECKTCGLSKSLDKFYNDRKTRDRKMHECKECVLKRSAINYAKNPSRNADGHRKHKYRLTPEQYKKLLEDQLELCAICSEFLDVPCVDHDHSTGQVRGLLCRNCNRGLGAFKDNTDLLQLAAKYLEAFGNARR